jgi:hypothetical protein
MHGTGKFPLPFGGLHPSRTRGHVSQEGFHSGGGGDLSLLPVVCVICDLKGHPPHQCEKTQSVTLFVFFAGSCRKNTKRNLFLFDFRSQWGGVLVVVVVAAAAAAVVTPQNPLITCSLFAMQINSCGFARASCTSRGSLKSPPHITRRPSWCPTLQ